MNPRHRDFPVRARAIGRGAAPGTHPETCQTVPRVGEKCGRSNVVAGQIITAGRAQSAAASRSASAIHAGLRGDGRVRDIERSPSRSRPVSTDACAATYAVKARSARGAGRPGDLYVEIRDASIRCHARGDDLHCQIQCTMTAPHSVRRSSSKRSTGEESVEVRERPGTQSERSDSCARAACRICRGLGSRRLARASRGRDATGSTTRRKICCVNSPGCARGATEISATVLCRADCEPGCATRSTSDDDTFLVDADDSRPTGCRTGTKARHAVEGEAVCMRGEQVMLTIGAGHVVTGVAPRPAADVRRCH